MNRYPKEIVPSSQSKRSLNIQQNNRDNNMTKFRNN